MCLYDNGQVTNNRSGGWAETPNGNRENLQGIQKDPNHVCARPALRTNGGNDDVDRHSNSDNYRYDSIIFLSITAK